MKNQVPKRTPFISSYAIKKIFIIPVIGFLLCLNSCKKDEKQNGIAPSNNTSALQSTAYTVLKSKATPQTFNDLDWSSVQVSKLNNVPYLLKIKSKSDNTKMLLYSKKNGVIHTRWVQLKSGSVIVTSLNSSNSIESMVKNGRVYAAKKIDVTGKVSVLNLKSFNDDDGDGDGDGGDGDIGNPGDGGGSVGIDDPLAGGDDGSGGGGGDGTGFDGGDDGDPGFTWDGINQLPEVTISATDNSTVDFYSLYILMGNNPAYLDEYTTDPSNPTANGNVITVAKKGTNTGVDPNFKPGQKAGIPLIKNTTGLAIGYVVGFSYSIGQNGITTVTGLTATLGGVTLGNTFTTIGNSSSTSGSIITFNITGTTDYNIVVKGIGTVARDPTTISGTYNTSNGAYSLTIH